MTPSQVVPSRKLLTKPFALLVLGHFMQALGYSSMVLLPLYLEELDASRTQIGMIMASASIGGLLLRPAVAWALDTWGRRPTLLAGTVALSVGTSLVFFVRDVGLMAYVQRVVFGIGVGALFTGYFTAAADHIPETRRTEGLALFGVSGLLPLAFVPVIGKLGIEPADLVYFFPGVGIFIFLSLFAVLGVPDRPRAAAPEPMRLGPVLRALRQPPLRPVWVASIVFSCFVGTFFSFATVAAHNRGISDPAGLWLTYTVGAISMRLFGGRLPDRIGTANLVAPALGTYAIGALVAATTQTASGFLVAGLLAGIGHGYCFPVLTSQVVSRAPEHLRGTGLAMFTALWEISALTLTPIFGLIADGFDDATMFAALALTGLTFLVWWAVLEHRHGPATRTRGGTVT